MGSTFTATCEKACNRSTSDEYEDMDVKLINKNRPTNVIPYHLQQPIDTFDETEGEQAFNHYHVSQPSQPIMPIPIPIILPSISDPYTPHSQQQTPSFGVPDPVLNVNINGNTPKIHDATPINVNMNMIAPSNLNPTKNTNLLHPNQIHISPIPTTDYIAAHHHDADDEQDTMNELTTEDEQTEAEDNNPDQQENEQNEQPEEEEEDEEEIKPKVFRAESRYRWQTQELINYESEMRQQLVALSNSLPTSSTGLLKNTFLKAQQSVPISPKPNLMRGASQRKWNIEDIKTQEKEMREHIIRLSQLSAISPTAPNMNKIIESAEESEDIHTDESFNE